MAAVIGHGWLAFVGVEGLIAVAAWYAWDKLNTPEKIGANVIGCIGPAHNIPVLLK